MLVTPSANGCLQQIAANGFSIPQDVIAILLQGFVRPAYATGEQERQSATLISTGAGHDIRPDAIGHSGSRLCTHCILSHISVVRADEMIAELDQRMLLVVIDIFGKLINHQRTCTGNRITDRSRS